MSTYVDKVDKLIHLWRHHMDGNNHVSFGTQFLRSTYFKKLLVSITFDIQNIIFIITRINFKFYGCSNLEPLSGKKVSIS